MHSAFQNEGGGEREISVTNLVVGQKILISRRGCIMGHAKFLKGVHEIFGEYKKLHNCSVKIFKKCFKGFNMHSG